MNAWIERIARLAALSERVTVLADGVKSPAGKVENHQARLVRLETIVEIVRPEGGVLRIAADPATGAPRGQMTIRADRDRMESSDRVKMLFKSKCSKHG